MIERMKGNLLEDRAEALVNTVNVVGVMGKGIALQFKQAFPEMFKEYHAACKNGEVQPGHMYVYETNELHPRLIINFPTKRHWKNKSRMEDIEAGLVDLKRVIKQYNIQSIAIPPLGCGNGGLDWQEVKQKIVATFESLPELDVRLYEPAGSPNPDEMKIRTSKPKMTRARALFISLMNEYSIPGYRLSLLEIQKLAYFLQELGEPLRLRFEKNRYGPYADNLNHVLLRIDGHFIRGFGDRNRSAEIYLLSDAWKQAEQFLQGDEEAKARLNRVTKIIEGFETPYGMELLATVHWIVRENPSLSNDPEAIIAEVHGWSERKRRTFKAQHVHVAWSHLNDLGLFEGKVNV